MRLSIKDINIGDIVYVYSTKFTDMSMGSKPTIVDGTVVGIDTIRNTIHLQYIGEINLYENDIFYSVEDFVASKMLALFRAYQLRGIRVDISFNVSSLNSKHFPCEVNIVSGNNQNQKATLVDKIKDLWHNTNVIELLVCTTLIICWVIAIWILYKYYN